MNLSEDNTDVIFTMIKENIQRTERVKKQLKKYGTQPRKIIGPDKHNKPSVKREFYLQKRAIITGRKNKTD